VPIHKEGYPFIGDRASCEPDGARIYFSQFFGWIFLILTHSGAALLPRSGARDAARDGIVVSPADGPREP
jgi:phosphatidylserine decarboxylase